MNRYFGLNIIGMMTEQSTSPKPASFRSKEWAVSVKLRNGWDVPDLGYGLLDIVRTMDKERIVAIARYLIYSIAANFAGIQMVHDIKLVIQR
jgi:hypothetical protein